MNICIEGCDCAGKSFIIKNLVEQTSFKIIPENHELKHTIKFDGQKELWKYFVAGYNVPILSILNEMDGWIKHRLHLSEYVYCNIVGRNSVTNFSYVEIDEFLSKSKVKNILILCEIDYETYCHRMKSKDKDERFWTKTEFDNTTGLFKEAFNNSKLEKILIDSTKPINEIIEKIKIYL